MEQKPYVRYRTLTCILLISGALNIVLGVLLFYWIIREVPPLPYYELKPAASEEQHPPLATEKNNIEIIRRFRTLPFEQLIAKLSNTQLVENGYTQRDLALGSLVTFHHFDLDRSLSGLAKPKQKRFIAYAKRPNGSPYKILVYPGLNDLHYQTIIRFAHNERWPQTSKGQFFLLKKQYPKFDPTLADAFFLTKEFLMVETLFNRSSARIDKLDLLKMICEGDWKMTSEFAEQQRRSQDLSEAKRQRFLLGFIEKKSQTAAYLILRTDGTFAVKKLDDHHILAILDLLSEPTPYSEKFSLALLATPRNDIIWKKASSRLYGYAGESIPPKFERETVLKKFFKKN